MPKVQKYQTQVLSNVTQGTRVQADQSQSQMLGDLANTTQQIGNVLNEQQQRANSTAAEEALNNFERSKNDLFFNPDSGYFNQQGRNAYDGADGVRKQLKDLKLQFAKDLSPESAALFDRAAADQIGRASVDIDRHASSGLNAWEGATINSRIENSIENAGLYFNEPEKLDVQRELGRRSVIDKAERDGITGEARNDMLQNYESSFASNAVTSAINTSSQIGEDALSKYAKRLDSADKVKLENALAKRKTLEAKQLIASESINKADVLLDKYELKQDMLDEVAKIENQDLREATRKAATARFNQRRSANSEAQASAFDDAEDFVYGGGSVQDFEAQQPEIWERLSEKQKATLAKSETVAIQTDWNKFNDLMSLPDDKLAKLLPGDHVQYLSKEQRSSLSKAIIAARRGTKDTESQVGRTRAKQVNDFMIQMLGPKKDFSSKDQVRYETYNRLIDDEVRARRDGLDRELTSGEFDDIIQGLNAKVVREGIIFDSEDDINDIPADQIQLYSEFLRAQGANVTTEGLLEVKRFLESEEAQGIEGIDKFKSL